MGKITDPRQFKAIAIASRGDYVVRIGDVGTVVDTHAELRSASFLNGIAGRHADRHRSSPDRTRWRSPAR